jgi:sulfate transport system ATP-binding protein
MSIILDNVSKSFEHRPVVKSISLSVEAGEFFVLLGSSGSGKSTLLRMIAGLTKLDSGRILLHDRDVTTLPPQQRGTGFVFQNYSLFQHMTVAQNIAFGMEIQKVPRAEREQRVRELLALIELEDYGQRRPSQLSGGQAQRVAVARALAPKPEVLLLDEPFGALDVKIRGQLRQNLRAIQRRLNVTTILVTHDQEEAFELADRIGVIDNGVLLEVGVPDQLYRQPRHRFIATFLGSANLLSARRNGNQVYVRDVSLPALENTEHLSNREVEVLLRPEAVELARNSADLRSPCLGSGTVESLLFTGALDRVSVRLDGWQETIQALLSADEVNRLNIRPGDKVWLGAKSYHLLPT